MFVIIGFIGYRITREGTYPLLNAVHLKTHTNIN